MNERITLLALKASDPKTGWLDRQKFAELIVNECMTICGAIQGAGESRNMSDFASGAAQCKAIIKRDFGVE
jgi:hypothetical protein